MASAKQFDRTEWLNKIKSQVDAKKVLSLTLRPNGATIQDVKKFLGKGYAIKNGEQPNAYILAVKQSD